MGHHRYRTETDCLNCGKQVTDKFCANCGQENIETHENFFHLAGHFIADYFHFDSKFLRSLRPLFVKPGFLTKEYWEGRRVSYIHPLRLFFFITILFMLSTSYFYKKFGGDLKGRIIHEDSVLQKLDDKQIATLHDTTKVKFKGREVTAGYLKKEKARDIRQTGKLRTGVDFVFKNLKYVTFFLLPVYALIFFVIYKKHRQYYVDHLVYAMHLQSFVYILMSVTLLFPFIFKMDIETMRQVSVVLIWIYVGISLHYLYRQVWWKTIIKSIFAAFLMVMITTLSIVLLAVADAVFVQ